MFSWLKKFMPRGLYGRAALIILLPVLGLQLTVGFVFIQRHFEGVTEQMTHSLLVDLHYITDEIASAPTLEVAQQRLRAIAPRLEINAELPGGADVKQRREVYDLTGRAVISELSTGLSNVEAVDLEVWKRVQMRVGTPHGPLFLDYTRARVSASNPHQLLVIMGVLGALLGLIAFIFLRNQLRPIARIARAAGAYGRGQVIPYKISGAREVRAAGAAFVHMRNRIERQSKSRALLLSGVSHDLRTPLTRMRLALSMMDGEEAEHMVQDVQDMERLVDAFLDYARGDWGEEASLTDPAALLIDAVDAANRAGAVQVTLSPLPKIDPMLLRPSAMRRALDNLITNAQRYGSAVTASIEQNDNQIVFRIEDNGPGIPEADRAEVMRPFSQLDPSRNQNTHTGVGLGLTIVSDIARSHGGKLRLSESSMGGLLAEIALLR